MMCPSWKGPQCEHGTRCLMERAPYYQSLSPASSTGISSGFGTRCPDCHHPYPDGFGSPQVVSVRHPEWPREERLSGFGEGQGGSDPQFLFPRRGARIRQGHPAVPPLGDLTCLLPSALCPGTRCQRTAQLERLSVG